VEDRLVLAQAVAQLSERERHLLELRYIRQLSQQRIGQIMDLSQMQISRLLRVIHQKMRAHLELLEEPDALDLQQAG